MLKAFLTYGSKPNLLENGKIGLRPRWPDLIFEAAKQHGDYITGMLQGVFPPDIGQDPREMPNPHEQPIYSQILSKSTSAAQN